MTESAEVFRYRREEVMLPRVRTDLREALLACRVPPDVVEDLAIVVAELVTNAVEYGEGPSVTVELAVRAIEYSSRKGENVLDCSGPPTLRPLLTCRKRRF